MPTPIQRKVISFQIFVIHNKGIGKKYSSLQQASPLQELACDMGQHSVTCNPAEVSFTSLPQPIKADTGM